MTARANVILFSIGSLVGAYLYTTLAYFLFWSILKLYCYAGRKRFHNCRCGRKRREVLKWTKLLGNQIKLAWQSEMRDIIMLTELFVRWSTQNNHANAITHPVCANLTSIDVETKYALNLRVQRHLEKHLYPRIEMQLCKNMCVNKFRIQWKRPSLLLL